MPSDAHHDRSRFSSTFFCLEMADDESLRGLSVGEKTLNSVLMVGTSTFTAPIVRGRLPATHKVGGGQDLRSREPRDVFAAQ